MNYKGQGSLEYLMLIAAAVVIVAVVISFIASMIPTVQDSGNEKNYDFVCNVLDSNTFECGCYLCDLNRIGINPKTNLMEVPNKVNCEELADLRNNPLLKRCTTFN
jgi:hypothetical protein